MGSFWFRIIFPIYSQILKSFHPKQYCNVFGVGSSTSKIGLNRLVLWTCKRMVFFITLHTKIKKKQNFCSVLYIGIHLNDKNKNYNTVFTCMMRFQGYCQISDGNKISKNITIVYQNIPKVMN